MAEVRFLITGRRGGKTNTLIDSMLRNPYGVAVVVDEQQRGRLVRELQNALPSTKGYWDQRVLCATRDMSLHGSYYGLRGRNGPIDLYIDNLDMILNMMFPNVQNITAMATGYTIEPVPYSVEHYLEQRRRATDEDRLD